ncbi:hypothetical protein I4F81_006649 [Pyropia yezoensis]|uniref:Uncharacterized protein n=1 Tax=Pyropia yezoensis TaxID=2788 RepID=A0ACC3C2C1_PYRYE|nr:hypothetical protein I4F81_006649 [Neopyropia yezoensis]
MGGGGLGRPIAAHFSRAVRGGGGRGGHAPPALPRIEQRVPYRELPPATYPPYPPPPPPPPHWLFLNGLLQKGSGAQGCRVSEVRDQKKHGSRTPVSRVIDREPRPSLYSFVLL